VLRPQDPRGLQQDLLLPGAAARAPELPGRQLARAPNGTAFTGGGPGVTPGVDPNTPIPGTTSDYAACTSNEADNYYWKGYLRWSGGGRNMEDYSVHGSRWPNFKTTFGTITDGTSNQCMIGDKHLLADQFNTSAGGDGPFYNDDTPWWHSRVMGRDPSPSDPSVFVDRLLANPNDTFEPWTRFGSYHPGVCQFVLGDGSVRALSLFTESIELTKWALPSDGGILQNPN
jgi:hypothetical protein